MGSVDKNGSFRTPVASRGAKPRRVTAVEPRARGKTSTGLSFSDYARRRGVSPKAVTVAVQDGRLRDSIGRRKNGRLFIASPDLADSEWYRNTQSSDRTLSEIAAAGLPPLAVSRARRAASEARLAELAVAEREGHVVSVDEIRAEVSAEYSLVKTRLLGIPSRLAQRLPHLAGEAVPVVNELMREALAELAADDGDNDDDA